MSVLKEPGRTAVEPYQDLRDWLTLAEELGGGELQVAEGADWNLEIGVVTELAQHRKDGPAVLFQKIKDYPEDYRVLVNSLGSNRRLAMTTGLPTDLTDRQLMQQLYRKLQETVPIEPRVVKDGPVLENVLTGDEVNVLKFPTPFWHEKDGGRYIGTGCVNITRDPDEGWVNLGTYRVMIHDEKNVFFYISPGKHGRIHRDKYFAAGEPCPVVVSIGHDPLLFLVSSLERPWGQTEYDYAGGIKGEPIDVIHGEYTGLPFPARSEIVIEGFAHPDRLEVEGPFGEWTGYYGSSSRKEPMIEVKAIYHRNSPIILGSPPGKPPTELTAYRAFLRSAQIKEELSKAGVPDVQDVWCHEAGGTRLLVAVSIEQHYPGHARQAGAVTMGCHAGAYLGRYVIVVDEDIDVMDLNDVVWAMCTRTDPAESIDIIRRMWSGPLDPRIPKEKKGFNSRAIIDATRPFEWKDEFPPVAESSREVQERYLAKWRHLFER